MALLNRMDWYDLARSTNWTPKYVTEDELFPPKLSGEFGLPLTAWDGYDEPFRVLHPALVDDPEPEGDAWARAARALRERVEALLKSVDGGV